ncbi:Uma2 family endonuclease [Actinomadura rayongensis]|uniref:Putative restriction endonuclease domain-containing protein n=1 Tax=Actinomadura rayongensis TaxID=1429076 RepID=A0A6I4WCC1_9ACTN|nr:Uma2 family endonuclease [Actinomadura rayongensis]MXQ64694.1 hypothetical protein [Actinomadura rayongensis]
MSTAHDYGDERGPHTIADLDELPEEGRQYELVHGWLIRMVPGILHEECIAEITDILRPHVPADHVLREGYAVAVTDDTLYQPDIALVARDAARRAKKDRMRAVTGEDVLLAVEVQLARSGSWNTVHHFKFQDYALAGIQYYWIFDVADIPMLTAYELDGDVYRRTHQVTGDEIAELDEPVKVAFSPSEITA